MRVAVDAMGGDHAPRELVAGAVDAAADATGAIVLVGRSDAIEAELDKLGGKPANVEVAQADDVIGMDDTPVEALKKNPDASIVRALRMMHAGEADAVVSAGSTGAAVAASMMTLKRLPGVRRPGIAVPMPAINRHGVCLLIDGGANPNCRAHHLAQYAVMGANYYRRVFDEPNPKVGILSIGEEEGKGNTLTREAAKMIRQTSLNFAGNVEGSGFFGGACHVAVTDGFVGNIFLKSAEGASEMLIAMLSEVLGKDNPEALRKIVRRVHYAEFGGAPLLGFEGVVMICHGRSDRRAISNAIRAGTRALSHHVNEDIVRGISQVASGSDS